MRAFDVHQNQCARANGHDHGHSQRQQLEARANANKLKFEQREFFDVADAAAIAEPPRIQF
jgi:hypothetical protein